MAAAAAAAAAEGDTGDSTEARRAASAVAAVVAMETAAAAAADPSLAVRRAAATTLCWGLDHGHAGTARSACGGLPGLPADCRRWPERVDAYIRDSLRALEDADVAPAATATAAADNQGPVGMPEICEAVACPPQESSSVGPVSAAVLSESKASPAPPQTSGSERAASRRGVGPCGPATPAAQKEGRRAAPSPGLPEPAAESAAPVCVTRGGLGPGPPALPLPESDSTSARVCAASPVRARAPASCSSAARSPYLAAAAAGAPSPPRRAALQRAADPQRESAAAAAALRLASGDAGMLEWLRVRASPPATRRLGRRSAPIPVAAAAPAPDFFRLDLQANRKYYGIGDPGNVGGGGGGMDCWERLWGGVRPAEAVGGETETAGDGDAAQLVPADLLRREREALARAAFGPGSPAAGLGKGGGRQAAVRWGTTDEAGAGRGGPGRRGRVERGKVRWEGGVSGGAATRTTEPTFGVIRARRSAMLLMQVRVAPLAQAPRRPGRSSRPLK